MASPVAVEPTVTCPNEDSSATPRPEVHITLTCENAISAAKAALGPDPTVTAIEFHRGLWCPSDRPCLAMLLLNGGWVVFHRARLMPNLVVVVTADQEGKVAASPPVVDPDTAT
jgi:hypothetical protein